MLVRNQPTPEGREFGDHLARFTDTAEEALRRQYPNHAGPASSFVEPKMLPRLTGFSLSCWPRHFSRDLRAFKRAYAVAEHENGAKSLLKLAVGDLRGRDVSSFW